MAQPGTANVVSIAFIGLGANLGDRAGTLEAAVAALGSAAGVEIRRRSSFYESAPVGVLDQPWFLNGVIEVATTLAPLDLLRVLQQIERDLGRRPTRRWGERVVDLDLLLYGNQRVDLPELVVPHPELWNRRFVLQPLAELAPELRAPDGRVIAEVAAALAPEQVLRPNPAEAASRLPPSIS
jgi:2-amino-4-hydroxy-6-hydroxymethyldihydropteridine diphosphokinase